MYTVVVVSSAPSISLRHFTFEYPTASCHPRTLSLPILAQLQYFYLLTPWSFTAIYPSLIRFAESNVTLVQLGIVNSSTGQRLSTYRKVVSQISVRLAAKFTPLPHFAFDETIKFASLQRLTSKFTGLISLTLHNLRELTFYQVAVSLAPLHQLVHLKMNSYSMRWDPYELYSCRSSKWPIEPQLTSLRVLELEPIFTTSHCTMCWCLYEWTFPCLEVLNLTVTRGSCCRLCRIPDFGTQSSPIEKRRACTKLMCQTMKTWQRLRHVNVSFSSGAYSVGFSVDEL